ncbi:MAG TPA: FAD-binding oxidoreductase [Chloroflexota bacterium]
MDQALQTETGLDEAIEALKTRFRGQLLRQGDDGYDAARVLWNGMIDRKPAVIARCSGAADVVAAVGFAREQNLSLAVKGGGHSVSGASICDGGIMIDLTPMKSIRVDPDARTARAEAGVNWGEFDAETQAFGLAMTGGQISHTGIAGLTLGGGVGWLARKYGMVVDNLLSVDIVTADGRLLHASDTENPDLFWAVRGGGGNFGIVTSFEYRLHPVGPLVVGGLAGFPIERGREILEFVRDFMSTAPDELAITTAFVSAPPAPFVPPEMQLKPIIGLAVCYCGSIEDGMRVLASVKALGPAFDVIGPMPYTAVQSMLDESSPYGTMRYYMKSGFLNEISDGAIDAMLSHASNPSSPFSTTVLVSLGGQMSRVDNKATAFGHREVRYDFTMFPGWINPAEDETHIAWVREYFEAMQPHLHGVYVNALMDEDSRLGEAYPPETYARLVEIKNRYDPTNLFRLNQNIRPTV